MLFLFFSFFSFILERTVDGDTAPGAPGTQLERGCKLTARLAASRVDPFVMTKVIVTVGHASFGRTHDVPRKTKQNGECHWGNNRWPPLTAA